MVVVRHPVPVHEVLTSVTWLTELTPKLPLGVFCKAEEIAVGFGDEAELELD